MLPLAAHMRIASRVLSMPLLASASRTCSRPPNFWTIGKSAMTANLEQSVRTMQGQIFHGAGILDMATSVAMSAAFGERLAQLIQLRKEQGAYKSEAELARQLGVQERRLNHYKGRSEPDYEMLTRICEALQTHPNYLLGWTEEIEPRYLDSISKIGSLQAEVAALRKSMQAFLTGRNSPKP